MTVAAEISQAGQQRPRWTARSAVVAVGSGMGVILAAFAADLSVPVLLAIGIATIVTVIVKPNLAVPLVVAAVFTNIAGNAVGLYGAPSIVPLALPAILLIAAWHAWFGTGRAVVWTPTISLILAFLLVHLIGFFLSNDTAAATDSVETLIIEGFGLCFLLVNAIRSRDDLRLALLALVASAAFIGAVALFQQVTGTYYTRYIGFAQLSDDAFATGADTLAGAVVQLRLGGMIGEKNYFAQFMLMVIPIGAALAAMQASWLRKTALAAGTLLIGVGIILTFSRGAAVAAAGLLATAFVLRMVSLRMVLVAALSVGLLVAAFPQYVTRIATVADVANLSADSGSELPDSALRGRAGENAAAIFAFVEHPLLGLGPGQFPSNYVRYARKAGVDDPHAAERRAHNLFLAMLAEVGIIGTAIFVAILVATAIPLLRIRRRAREPGDVAIATGLLLGLLAFLFAGVFLDLAYARYFWLLIGLAGAAGTVLAPTLRPSQSTPDRSDPHPR